MQRGVRLHRHKAEGHYQTTHQHHPCRKGCLYTTMPQGRRSPTLDADFDLFPRPSVGHHPAGCGRCMPHLHQSRVDSPLLKRHHNHSQGEWRTAAHVHASVPALQDVHAWPVPRMQVHWLCADHATQTFLLTFTFCGKQIVPMETALPLMCRADPDRADHHQCAGHAEGVRLHAQCREFFRFWICQPGNCPRTGALGHCQGLGLGVPHGKVSPGE